MTDIFSYRFYNFRDLERLRGYLTREASPVAANTLVGSHLDFCNSLFSSLSALDLHRLQCVQISLNIIVANITKYSHITPIRKSLHWSPTRAEPAFWHGIIWIIIRITTKKEVVLVKVCQVKKQSPKLIH